MFNTTSINLGKNSQTVVFNTPSTGMMQKSNPQSKFIRFQKGSAMEGEVFPTDGSQSKLTRRDKYDRNENIPITVLQVLVFGDNYYLCEIVFNKDLVEEPELKP